MLLRRAARLFAAGAVITAACTCATSEAPVVPRGGDAGDAAGDALAESGRKDVEDVTCERGDASATAVPSPYAGRKSPVAGDDEAIAAGRTFFGARCALCHGSLGRGDGPEGPADPRPADLTMVQRADDHLFWRVSAGGRTAPFCSAMPSFDYLPERTRWQIVEFVKTLAPRDAGASDAASE